MNNETCKVTLLSREDVFGEDKNGKSVKKSDIIKKIGTKCAVTDFATVLGACSYSTNHVPYDPTAKGYTTRWVTCSGEKYGLVVCIEGDGSINVAQPSSRKFALRPVIMINDELMEIIESSAKKIFRSCIYVKYGEYPQYAVDKDMKKILHEEYEKGNLKKTGKTYTTDSYSRENSISKFKENKYTEYEYKGKKYVRMVYNDTPYQLTPGYYIDYGSEVWIEVSPIEWYVDYEKKVLISRTCLVGGIRMSLTNRLDDDDYDEDFNVFSEAYKFLNEYFIKEIKPNRLVEEVHNDNANKKFNKKEINPYGLKFKEVSEEDIIKGAIETGVAVFLHGPSSEGKSARIKAIDPDCKIIYLRNASPDSLNGKSVYNEQTGEMIDVKPTWLKQLEEKCEKEKDKLHIVFFDEITNALPSIQGIAFNIVLDREVNGMWKLPENARIVAAGNDMKDSLAANQLAEPLYNRFAHVFIKTTTMGWLKWASEHNIHPAIYSFIAYKKGSVLRSEYTGDKPNADPRKWEMASNMLYKTENPNMLRALVGEDITREFVQFCKQKVITLEDVLKSEYKKEDVDRLNTAEKYATVMGISMAEEKDLEKVRDFAKLLGSEITAVFDAMWARGDEARLERIAEVKLKDKKEVKDQVIKIPPMQLSSEEIEAYDDIRRMLQIAPSLKEITSRYSDEELKANVIAVRQEMIDKFADHLVNNSSYRNGLMGNSKTRSKY